MPLGVPSAQRCAGVKGQCQLAAAVTLLLQEILDIHSDVSLNSSTQNPYFTRQRDAAKQILQGDN
jgi:hypothetical protein